MYKTARVSCCNYGENCFERKYTSRPKKIDNLQNDCYLKQFDDNTINIMILSSPFPTNNGRLWQVGKIRMKINFENGKPSTRRKISDNTDSFQDPGTSITKVTKPCINST